MSDELDKTEYDDIYTLSDEEGKRNRRGLLNALLYLILAVVVVLTGAHGIMLVLSQTAGFELSGMGQDNGVVTMFLTAARISFPIIMEAAAVVAGIGFIQSRWRGTQRTYGAGIELAWLVFAGANMWSVFTLEMGGALQPWQLSWIQYGLPLSALVAGALTYMLLREDPDHKRQQERAATSEKIAGIRFRNFQKVMLSPEMMKIEQQMAYLQAVERLKQMGYTPAQIRFLTQHIPELSRDADGNGTPDILEITGNVPTPPQIPTEAPTNGASPNMRQLGFDAPNSPQGQRQADLPPAGNGRAPGNERPKASSRPVQPAPNPASSWDDDEPSATITFDGNYSSPHEFMTEEEFRQYWNDGMTPLERAQADLRRIEMEEAEQAGREWQAQHREQRREQMHQERLARIQERERQEQARQASAPPPPAPELPPTGSSGRVPGNGKEEPGK